MSTIILPDVTAFIAALLFAVHPIHTEAVSMENFTINSQFNVHHSFQYKHQTMSIKEPENLILCRRHRRRRVKKRKTCRKKFKLSTHF
jgi:hypothetical protein